MVSPLSTIIIWVFYMLYPGYGHEDYNSLSLLGMIMLAGGSFYFVQLEMIDLELEGVSNTESDIQLSLAKDQ